MARMSSVADLFPPLGLTIEAGPLVMRGISDEILPELCDLAVRGIHDPAAMPFYFPWTDAPLDQLARNTAAFHWRSRASFGPAEWGLHLAVFHEGRLVGTQGLDAADYLVTRTAETGSWLGREFQGLGIGTAMRQAICAFAFDHLDAAAITSGAFLDNPSSLGVSRKVGYQPNGIRRLKRREGELALNQALVLTPSDLVRGPHELHVTGLEALRVALGLDA
jgi:RimJ/RimL family protein N-acetyltransferase